MSDQTDEQLALLRAIAKDAHVPRFLGMKINEIAYVAVLVLGVASFYWRTDDTLRRLTAVSEYVVRFMANSDTYHSAVVGVQFQQGQPVQLGASDVIEDVREVIRKKK